MATLAGVMALRACVANLLDPRTGEAIQSPIIALYEIEQVDAKGSAGANASGPLSALVLKDAAALPTESAAALDQNDPATLLLVQPPTHAALFSRPTPAEAAAAAATAAQRTLHFRVYHALPKEGKDGAAGGSGGGADDDMDLGFDADSDDEGSGQRFELLGSCALLASELAQAARTGVALELSLRNALSPLCSQTLKRAGTALTLHVRPASPSESGEERAFERLLELAHGDRFQGLPQRVAADETSHQALLALHLSALRLPVDEPVEGDEAVPRGDGAADDSVYLAAVFERDLRSGDMKLQGVTPWTRSNPAASATALHFPGRVCVDYFPGEMQLFQVSVYKFRAHQLARALASAASSASSPAGGAEAEAAAAQVPPELFAMLREEERVGSCEFYLDYFGLESGFLVSQRAAAAQAHARGDYAAELSAGPPALPASVGRLSAAPGRAHLLRLEMPLAHDVSSRAQADLARTGAAVVVGLDASATTMRQNARVSVSVGVGAGAGGAAAAGSVPDDLDLGVTAGVSAHSDEEISRMNQEQLDRAMRLLAGSGDDDEARKRAALALPPNAVPDAADVDVSGAEDGVSVADSADMNARLLRMMQQGQTFLSHEVGRAPRAQKLFYVPSSDPVGPDEPALPGLLYLCEVEQDPAVLARDPVALANLQCIDLCSMTDIFLGKQSPAFHADGVDGPSADGSDPAEDDSVSFSLVTSNSTSLNLEALSAKKRAAWILGLMGCLKQEGEEEGEEEQQQ